MPMGVYPHKKRSVTLEESVARFWAHVRQSDGCWEWTNAPATNGYGRIKHSGRWWMAHRLSWSLTNGPIPPNRVVCHHCDNRMCVRPDHLFVGTQHENLVDASQKGRLFKHHKRTHCKRGHPLTGKNVRRRYGRSRGRMCMTCTNAARHAWRAQEKVKSHP